MLPSYATRLRTIHSIATKKIYGVEATITAAETSEGRFEAFMTVGKIKRRYIEMPLKSATAIETIATYHSLKYITNVLGYKIIDVNYPTLSQLVSAINKQNEDTALLQDCVQHQSTY